MKKIICNITLILVISITLINGGIYNAKVYADDVPSGYSPAGVSDQVDAFRSYCKSRNLAIEGSMFDALTSVTSKVYQDLVVAVGLDVNQLQNEIYKKTDGSTVNYFFTATGITAMNRIFAEFLQNQDLDVGDTVVDQPLYSGKWFVDADGNGCLVYTLNTTSISGTSSGLAYSSNATFLDVGTDYKYSSEQILTMVGTSNYTFNFNLSSNLQYSQKLTYYTYTSQWPEQYNITDGKGYNYGHLYYSRTLFKDGSQYYPAQNPKFIICQRNDQLYFCAYSNNTSNLSQTATAESPVRYKEYQLITNANATNANVYITTNNTTINNNNYEGDTIINNEGDIVKKNYEYNYPITNPTPVPTPNNISWPTIDLPDLDLDFRIDGLTEKFPFSIPGDLVAFYTILNTEAQAPSIDRTIPLGFTDWHFQADFSQFESYAEIVRKVEFIGFVVGLIYITIRLVKG